MTDLAVQFRRYLACMPCRDAAMLVSTNSQGHCTKAEALALQLYSVCYASLMPPYLFLPCVLSLFEACSDSKGHASH